MNQDIIDRLEYAHGFEDDITGQHYELWHDPETDKEYWVPVDKVYRWSLIQEATPTNP
jgi:hypothetical protein